MNLVNIVLDVMQINVLVVQEYSHIYILIQVVKIKHAYLLVQMVFILVRIDMEINIVKNVINLVKHVMD